MVGHVRRLTLVEASAAKRVAHSPLLGTLWFAHCVDNFLNSARHISFAKSVILTAELFG